jgi:hypothetical protein
MRHGNMSKRQRQTARHHNKGGNSRFETMSRIRGSAEGR